MTMTHAYNIYIDMYVIYYYVYGLKGLMQKERRSPFHIEGAIKFQYGDDL